MSREEWGFVLEPEYCIHCHACENACRTWRGLKPDIKYRRVDIIRSGEFPNPKLLALTVSCMHCVEPKCMEVCPVNAITKDEDGIVIVDPELCVGCRACFDACPYKVPQFDSESGIMQKCDMCSSIASEEQKSPCVTVCPTHALTKRRLSVNEKMQSEKALLEKLR